MLIRQVVNYNRVLRRHITALYVTGDKAKENYAVLSPFLDFEKLSNIDRLQNNLKRRNIVMDLQELKDEWKLFSNTENKKKCIEARRVEIAQLVRLSPNEAMKIEGKQLREDLKQLKDHSYHLEDHFVHSFLSLPNDIHAKTPDVEPKIIYSFKDLQKSSKSKSKEGTKELIEFYNSACYFLKGEAAKFDIYTPMQILDYFREQGFINFSNPDFTRSIIAEGAGVNQEGLFLLKEDDIENKLNLLHLTGSASLLSYLSFVTKLTVFPNILPLKFICAGRQYNAQNHFDHQDLYNMVQSTCCETFICTADGSDVDTIVEQQVEHLKNIYEPFNQHFRIVYYPAHQLKLAESLKIGVQMFAPSLDRYIEIGNFAYCSDFISKRLLFNYKIGKDLHFPHIFNGTVANVMRLMTVLLENNSELKISN